MQIQQLSQVGQIKGDIFAAEPMAKAAHGDGSFIAAYGMGYGDTWMIETHKDAWIANGCNDDIPYLHRLIYRRSTIHNSAVNLKANLIAGGGFTFTPLESYFRRDENGVYELVNRAYTDIEREQIIQQARVLAKNIGLDFYRKSAATQLALYGGYYGLRGYGRNPQSDVALMQLFIEDYQNVRMSAKREWMDGHFYPVNYYFSRDWHYAMPYKTVSYEEFAKSAGHVNNTSIGKLPGEGFSDGTGFRVKFCGRESPYRNYYATPDYESVDALTYMDIDYMISQRDLKDISSGFSLDHIIVRYRKPEDSDEAERVLRQQERDFIKKNFKGYEGDRSMITWAEPHVTDNGSIDTPKLWDIIEIPHQNNPERFNILREERLMKILNAHTIVSGELIGLPRLSNTGFSSQAEFLITAQEQLFFTVIRPMQEIMEADIQDIMIQAGIPVSVRTNKSAINFRQLTAEILKWAWGKDEIRDIHGWERMTEEVAEELMRTEGVNQKSSTNA